MFVIKTPASIQTAGDTSGTNVNCYGCGQS
jgi:hypothetical protein